MTKIILAGHTHRPKLIHFGDDKPVYHDTLRAYAEQIGYDYDWVDKQQHLAISADKLKYASMMAIWNGKQCGGGLAALLCKRRGIPHFFFENGMLPQMGTFFIDPTGFCADSILNTDLSWITDEDMDKFYAKRKELQAIYPLHDEGFILAAQQVQNDSSVLYYSDYIDVDQFIEDVESTFPDDRIVTRPHPNGSKYHTFARAEEIFTDDFLSWAARSKRVVAITSTCLYEATVLGVPVTVFGDHPLKTHPPELHDKVAAGALALCAPRNGNIKSILERFGYGNS